MLSEYATLDDVDNFSQMFYVGYVWFKDKFWHAPSKLDVYVHQDGERVVGGIHNGEAYLVSALPEVALLEIANALARGLAREIPINQLGKVIDLTGSVRAAVKDALVQYAV